MEKSVLDVLASEVRGEMRQSVLLKIIKDVRHIRKLANVRVTELVKKNSAKASTGAAS